MYVGICPNATLQMFPGIPPQRRHDQVRPTPIDVLHSKLPLWACAVLSLHTLLHVLVTSTFSDVNKCKTERRLAMQNKSPKSTTSNSFKIRRAPAKQHNGKSASNATNANIATETLKASKALRASRKQTTQHKTQQWTNTRESTKQQNILQTHERGQESQKRRARTKPSSMTNTYWYATNNTMPKSYKAYRNVRNVKMGDTYEL